ncbi:unnamed protein product [Symbiodinium necroappetens]|uniref:Uncharacterized protein n=1 Tax=Symbiodinium necroappetens TaxID=1628268 RepID=A0A812SCE5_9DINO|nr:unnamed protein product [Symbiodinium necroappetens]
MPPGFLHCGPFFAALFPIRASSPHGGWINKSAVRRPPATPSSGGSQGSQRRATSATSVGQREHTTAASVASA